MSASQEKKPGRLHGLLLARSSIDRAGDIRTDSAKLDSLWRSAKILVLVKDRFHASDAALIFHDSISIHGIGERYFLGIDRETGVGYFVWHTDEEIIDEDDLRALRQIGAMLSDKEAGLAVHALGLANWHHTHPCCSRCGAKTRIGLGGAVRICDVDGSEHHPRTDPAVIVLVKDEADRLLLGRQRVWVEKLFSNFAGFVEPGESFEQSVVREVSEESGVLVHSVHYLGSQPWPFPASIMIAFEAITSDPDVARPDGEEIVELRWYSREEMRDAVKSGELILPSQISVSRRMIEHWYGAGAAEDLSAPHGSPHGSPRG
ncbi:MAG: NAD(+) diphosphatase [Candidatus Nanopelagicaceae bacterium]|jgi:NAD+ diphosphatase